jgi:hypothetical protein
VIYYRIGDSVVIDHQSFIVTGIMIQWWLSFRLGRWCDEIFWRLMAWMDAWDERFALRYD